MLRVGGWESLEHVAISIVLFLGCFFSWITSTWPRLPSIRLAALLTIQDRRWHDGHGMHNYSDTTSQLGDEGTGQLWQLTLWLETMRDVGVACVADAV